MLLPVLSNKVVIGSASAGTSDEDVMNRRVQDASILLVGDSVNVNPVGTIGRVLSATPNQRLHDGIVGITNTSHASAIEDAPKQGGRVTSHAARRAQRTPRSKLLPRPSATGRQSRDLQGQGIQGVDRQAVPRVLTLRVLMASPTLAFPSSKTPD